MKLASILLLTSVLLSACSGKEKSLFFEDCFCDKIDFSKGVNVVDSLNHYSVKYPSKNWQTIRNLNEFHNGVTGFNSESKKLEALAITETTKGEHFISAEEELKKDPFKQVVQQGKIRYLGKQRDWRLIKHDDEPLPYYSLYLTVEIEKVVHTINITVEQGKNYKDNICRLEKYLEQINIF